MSDTPDPEALAADLVAWGRVIVLETHGRTSQQPRRASIGFVEQPDGSLLVAASSESTHWARNLLADPECVVTREGERQSHQAVALDGLERIHAVRSLILKYGTPSEGLGDGPAFRLEPIVTRERIPGPA